MSLGPPHGPTGPIAMAGKDTPNPQKGTPSSNPCYLQAEVAASSVPSPKLPAQGPLLTAWWADRAQHDYLGRALSGKDPPLPQGLCDKPRTFIFPA